jgi:uncharacterized membrane protein
MTRKYFIVGFALIVACLLVTALLFPHLPSRIPIHWNARGQVNGYGPRWSLFLICPGMMLGMLGLFAVLPWLSPRQFEVESFRSTYLYIMVVIVAFMAYLHALMLWSAVSGQVTMQKTNLGVLCLLNVLLGNVMGKVKRNFYIGIRTPWTIADERVWNATHRLGARTMFVGGLAGLILAFAGAKFWIVMAMLIASVLMPAIYSLVYYKQLERRGQIA